VNIFKFIILKVERLNDEKTVDTFVTELDKGIISRAEMGIGSDGSGKLITYLRKNGKKSVILKI